jgi:hypothetical protein
MIDTALSCAIPRRLCSASITARIFSGSVSMLVSIERSGRARRSAACSTSCR